MPASPPPADDRPDAAAPAGDPAAASRLEAAQVDPSPIEGSESGAPRPEPAPALLGSCAGASVFAHGDPPPPCASLRALVAGDCAALRARRRGRWLLFAGLALAATAALWRARHWVRPPSCVAPDTVVGHGGGLGAAVGWGGVAAVGLGLVGLGFGVRLVPRRWLRPLAILGAVGGLALTLGLAVTPVGADGAPVADGPGIGCLALGLAWGLLLAGLAWALGRRLMRRNGPLGLVLGVGSGLVALALLQTVCPTAGPLHAALGHGTVPALLGLLGMFLWTRTETA